MFIINVNMATKILNFLLIYPKNVINKAFVYLQEKCILIIHAN